MEVAAVWLKERKRGVIDTKSDVGNEIWLPDASHAGV